MCLLSCISPFVLFMFAHSTIRITWRPMFVRKCKPKSVIINAPPKPFWGFFSVTESGYKSQSSYLFGGRPPCRVGERQSTAIPFLPSADRIRNVTLFRALGVIFPFCKCNNVPILGNGTLIDILPVRSVRALPLFRRSRRPDASELAT